MDINKRLSQMKEGIFDYEDDLLGPNLIVLRPDDPDELWDMGREYVDIYHIPNTSFFQKKIIIVKGKIYKDIFVTFGLDRIEHIKQFTHIPYVMDRENTTIYGFPNHTRGLHSITAAIMIEIRMRMSGKFSEGEINTGIFMACLHDAATNTFGDMMKYFHKDDFDEEKNLEDYIKFNCRTDEVMRVCNKYQVDINEIIGAISHKKPNKIYKFFNWFDRINYTAWDWWHIKPPNDLSEFGYPQIKMPLCDFGDCYLDIDYDDSSQTIIWDYSERLMQFLFVRSVLARNFYFNPLCRAVEIYIAHMFNYFYPKFVSKEELLRQIDYGILAYLAIRPEVDKKKFARFKYFVNTTSVGLCDEINERIISNKRKRGYIKLYKQEIKFKPGLDILVRYKNRVLKIEEIDHPLIPLIRENKTMIEKPITYYINKQFK